MITDRGNRHISELRGVLEVVELDLGEAYLGSVAPLCRLCLAAANASDSVDLLSHPGPAGASTDGVDDTALAATLGGALPSSETCQRLAQLALDGGGRDNITAIVATFTWS